MIKRRLDSKEKIAWIRLARTPRVGPVTFLELLRRYQTPQAALEALPALARRGGGKESPQPPPLGLVEDEIRALEKKNGQFIALCEPEYPQPLVEISDPPPVLAVLGHPALLNKACFGIVGARNASLSGRKMAEKLAEELGKQGYVIASGLARGIDAAAHAKALETGTIAALAGGVDVIYPEENKALYNRIAHEGCLISDQPMGMEPRAILFPRRNRLISGVSVGVAVVEAAHKSGSLITAHMALDQGREVFAVPGSPLDPRARGANDLIRQGAVLTESAADILEHLRRPKSLFSEKPPAPFDEPFPVIDEAQLANVREKIIGNLSCCPITVDELARDCHVSLPLVLTVLLELELAGRLERQPGNRVALVG